MGLGLAVVLARVVRLQNSPDERLEETAAQQHFRRIERTARRGSIYDRNGRLLAHSVEAQSVFVDPKGIEDFRPLARALSDCLDLQAEEVLARLEGRRDTRFVWIARRITEEQCSALRQRLQSAQASTSLKGAHLQSESRRVYVFGGLAGQVLGFVEEGGGGKGLEALEAQWERPLHGENGYQAVKRDVRGRQVIMPELTSQSRRPGLDLHLSIDSVIQEIVESQLAEAVAEFRPANAFAVVVDPRTGDVLAMASEPSFDPTRFREYPPDELKQRCRNRVVADAFEFGSVFKPFTVAAALNEGLVNMDTVFHCGNGSMRIGRRILHDHHPYGNLAVTEVLVKSSNVGAVKIAQMLGRKRLYGYLRKLGLGQLTGIRFPGEAPGIFRPLSEWTDYSLPSVTLGHEVSITPLQLAMAFSALANGGVLMTPRLVRQVSDPERQTTWTVPVRPVRQVFRASVVREQLTPALQQVVERGTGRRAKLKGYRLAGKTGTAEKLQPGHEGRHLASFIAFGPVPEPKLVIYVGVDEPQGAQYGGQVAAPYVGAIFEKAFEYLQLDPKVEVASQ